MVVTGGVSGPPLRPSETLTGFAPERAEGTPMRKQKKHSRLTVEIRINVGSCLYGLAAILWVLV